jgi:hypothetical protein
MIDRDSPGAAQSTDSESTDKLEEQCYLPSLEELLADFNESNNTKLEFHPFFPRVIGGADGSVGFKVRDGLSNDQRVMNLVLGENSFDTCSAPFPMKNDVRSKIVEAFSQLFLADQVADREPCVKISS